MIASALTFLVLLGAAVAAPIFGNIASGAGFKADGTTAAGASADSDSGIAASALEGIGSVLGIAGPGLATAASLASPSL